MKSRVDLIWFGDSGRISWPLGEVWPTERSPSAVLAKLDETLQRSPAQFWLFWDCTLGEPNPEHVREAMTRPGDLWHAGLVLGMGGLPNLIDFVHPIWMLNRDPPASIEATSWRLSLKACLVRTDVLHQMASVRPEFLSLDGAALEMGHRYVMRGVMTRHIPWLVPKDESSISAALPFEDELRFVFYRFGCRWSRWALWRALWTGYITPIKAFTAWRTVRRALAPTEPTPYKYVSPIPSVNVHRNSVSVIIPTLDRYPYLRTLLAQLGRQTVKPHEIIVIDQTPIQRRDRTLPDAFPDLPLSVLTLDKPGQCSSRNVGLQVATRDNVLFLDDDDEVPPTLIEAHLRNIHRFDASVSSGVAEEVGAGPLPEAFTYTRLSDVFPTNNSLLRKDVLHRSGLFDMAYEHGKRADGDLGTRIYLSGALMVLNPHISILHHHAPSGGLRAHKARAITYASSRKNLLHRHIPSHTEIYLALRYFNARQGREMIVLGVFGTFALRGSVIRKVLKLLISFLLLPHTLWSVWTNLRRAKRMLQSYPQIPILPHDNPDTSGEAAPVAVVG